MIDQDRTTFVVIDGALWQLDKADGTKVAQWVPMNIATGGPTDGPGKDTDPEWAESRTPFTNSQPPHWGIIHRCPRGYEDALPIVVDLTEMVCGRCHETLTVRATLRRSGPQG